MADTWGQVERVKALRAAGATPSEIDQFIADEFGGDRWPYDYRGNTETSFPGPESPASASRERERQARRT